MSDEFEFDIDREILVELGRLLYSASYLEEVLLWIFGTLTTAGPVGDTVGAFQPFAWLVERTRWLADLQLREGQRDQVNDWLNRAKRAQEARNRIVHASWYVDATELSLSDQGLLRHGLRRFHRKKATLELDQSLIEPADVRAAALECEQAGLAGFELQRNISYALGKELGT